MKRAVLFVVSLYCYLSSTAQFYDRGWLIGGAPLTKLMFNTHSTDTSMFNSGVYDVRISRNLSNISDTSGNILFFYNGVTVGNSLSQVMNAGSVLPDSLFSVFFQNGFTEHQTSLILPISGSLYYLFYYSISDSLFATQTIATPDRLYYAVIDMNQNGGLGKVITKKKVVYKGLFGDCRLTACRHANGRDWWMVHQGYRNNEYFVYRVTPDSVYPPMIQHIGPSDFHDENFGAQSTFSPDGNRFATVSLQGPLVLMNFNRCDGIFSSPDSIFIPIDTLRYVGNRINVSTNGGSGVSFSGNGRFLYLSNSNDIIQYDAWASDIKSSSKVVGRYDSLISFPGFNQLFLMPDGRIIIDNLGGGQVGFHIVENPNVEDTACHFQFNGLYTSYIINATILPNMINYRLGRLLGSSCDTLTSIDDVRNQNNPIRIYPNPASEYLSVSLIEYHKDSRLFIYDILGKEVYNESIYLDHEVDIHNFSSGIYIIKISSPDGDHTCKFVKE